MISRWVRTWYSKVLEPFLLFLVRVGITANMLTIASLILVIIAAVLLVLDNKIWGACILMLGAFLDGIDGELARVSRVKSPLGAFLDSICDHCGDFTIYLGLLFGYIGNHAYLEILLIFVAMFASVFGSHVRSRAHIAEIDTKTVGFFTRFERIFLLFICIVIGNVTIALWGLAIFNSLSAVQRVMYTIQAYKKRESFARGEETI
jgi:archaetidylinositol phosphate synthase